MVFKCMTVLFNLFLHYILLVFQVVEIIGGGGQNDMFASPPPQYFHWDRSPRIDASAPPQKTENYPYTHVPKLCKHT